MKRKPHIRALSYFGAIVHERVGCDEFGLNRTPIASALVFAAITAANIVACIATVALVFMLGLATYNFPYVLVPVLALMAIFAWASKVHDLEKTNEDTNGQA